MYTKYIYLREIPLVRFISAYILGTLIALIYPSSTLLISAYIISLCALIASIFIRTRFKVQQLRIQIKIVSLLLFLSISTFAYILGVLHHQKNYSNHFSHFVNTDTSTYLEVIIQEPIIEKENSIKIISAVHSIQSPHQTIKCTGKLLIYLQTNSKARNLLVGQSIFVKAQINNIPKAHNPNEFDYKKYLEQQNIYHSTYLRQDDWLVVASSNNLVFQKVLAQLSAALEHVLAQFITSEALPIAKAILIGQKDDLDHSTMKRFAKSGAMHVLAVSGLHVGIVFLVFHYGFIFLDYTRFKGTKPYLIILLLWTYALLTGASPSVLRATTMFSFIAVGNALKQHVNIYNMIAASAFILILVNPYVILALGFQLSYLAVIGIIYLQPKIYQLLVFKPILLDKIWSLTSVSIAAQLATFPLGLLYFHQFPNLFFISNLIVIPAAILIVYLGMALIATHFLPFVPKLFGFLLSKIIMLMNSALDLMNSIPYSSSTGIYITPLTCLLLYLFMISFIFGLTKRNKQSFLFSLFTLLGMLLIGFNNLYQIHQSKILRVYNISDYAALELQNGFACTHYFDQALILDTNTIAYSIEPNWWANHLRSHEFNSLPNDYHALSFANKSILIINSNFILGTSEVEIDYCIFTGQEQLWLKTLSTKIKAGKYIFDASNNPYKIKYWKKDCEDLNLDCYFVSEQNAFEEKLN